MAASLIIRAAQPPDIDTLIALASNAFRDTYGDGHNTWDIEDYVAGAFTPAAFAAILGDPTSDLLIGHDASGAAGYAHVRRTPPPACVTGTNPVELVRLYLRKDAIGGGYGAAFMRRVFDIARNHGCDMMWLGVYDQNVLARQFYRRWGFADVGRKGFLFGGIEYSDPLMAAPVPVAPGESMCS